MAAAEGEALPVVAAGEGRAGTADAAADGTAALTGPDDSGCDDIDAVPVWPAWHAVRSKSTTTKALARHRRRGTRCADVHAGYVLDTMPISFVHLTVPARRTSRQT
jgi:hypothetical protein